MALTRRDLELMDRRRALQAGANDEAGTNTSRARARLNLRRLDEQITKAPEPAAPAKQPNNVVPLPEPRNGPPVGAKPGVQSPLVPSVPPEAEKIAQSPVTPPTMDDAARDAAAAAPLDPVARMLGQQPRRKKYGSATTALTGETGLGNIGNVASRVLLG